MWKHKRLGYSPIFQTLSKDVTEKCNLGQTLDAFETQYERKGEGRTKPTNLKADGNIKVY